MESPIPRPQKILFPGGQEGQSLAACLHPAPITAFVGGGGKTSTMLALGAELARRGLWVTVSTTTRMWPVRGPLPRRMRVAGVLDPRGKLGPVADPEALKRDCDILLLEADGSRGLPAKAPAAWEPVLTPNVGLVVAVQGLTAYEGPIKAVCHRPERVAALLGKDVEDWLTPKDGAALLTSPQGQRKDVGERRYQVVLNQADDPAKIRLGEQIAAQLPPKIPCILTCYDTKGAYKL